MKTTITILFLALTSYVSAQITVNLTLPVANTATIKMNVSNGNIIDTAQVGTNQTWDFSGLIPSYTDTTFYFSPENGPYMGDTAFPLSYLGCKETNSDDFQYFTNTNGDFYFDGQCVPSESTVMKFIPQMKYMPKTIAYNDEMTENPVATMYSKYPVDETTTIDIKTIVSINRKIKADSWGTLKTPKGSFSALRIKQVMTFSISSYMNMGFGWTPAGAPSTNSEISYLWLGNDFNVLLEAQYDTDSSKILASYKDETINHTYIYNNTVGINKNISESFTSVYPNPVSDNLIITKSTSDQVNLRIYNINGSAVNSYTLKDNTSSIDIKNLTNGIYFYTLESKGQIIKTNTFIKN